MRPRNTEAGMTLVELLAVIVLIALIGTVVIRGVFGTSEAAKARLNGLRMEKVQGALASYRLEFSRFPAQLTGLVRPSADVAKSGKAFFAFASEDDLKDVWGADYVYRTEGDNRSYSLTSLGADGKDGGAGADQDVTVRP